MWKKIINKIINTELDPYHPNIKYTRRGDPYVDADVIMKAVTENNDLEQMREILKNQNKNLNSNEKNK